MFIPRKATNCGFSLAMNTNSCVAQADRRGTMHRAPVIPHLRALHLMLIAYRKNAICNLPRYNLELTWIPANGNVLE